MHYYKIHHSISIHTGKSIKNDILTCTSFFLMYTNFKTDPPVVIIDNKDVLLEWIKNFTNLNFPSLFCNNH